MGGRGASCKQIPQVLLSLSCAVSPNKLWQSYGLLVVLPVQDFFETCAMLITVVILGKYMECQAKGKTSEAIQVLHYCLLTHSSNSPVWCEPALPCSSVLVLVPWLLQTGGGHA
jgi:hypothetical protein